jgi:hypothetical protein
VVFRSLRFAFVKMIFEAIFLCLFEQLRPVLGSQRHNLLHELGLLGFIELRRRRDPSRNRRSDCCEKLFLAGGRADAEQPGGVGRCIVKTMGRVGGNVDGVSCFQARFLTTERRLHFTFQNNESLLEVVAMGRRSTSRWNVHVDHAEFARCFRAGDGDGVGVSDQTNVRKSFLLIDLSKRQISLQVVGGNGGIL